MEDMRGPQSSEEYSCWHKAYNYMPRIPPQDYPVLFEMALQRSFVINDSMTDAIVMQSILMDKYGTIELEGRSLYDYIWKHIGGIDNCRSVHSIYDRDEAYYEVLRKPYERCVYCGHKTKGTCFVHSSNGDRRYAYHEACKEEAEIREARQPYDIWSLR